MRHLPREHLIEHTSDGIDVGTVVHAARAFQCLGRHEVRRTYRDIAGGIVAAVRAGELSEAKVGDLHAAISLDDDVRGLNVAVDYALAVCIGERLAHARGDAQRLRHRELALCGDELRHVCALDAFHDQIEQPIARLARFIDGDDARMPEFRHGPSLLLKTFRIVHPVVFDVSRENLNGDHARESHLPCLINHSHASAPEDATDFILRKIDLQFLRRGRLPTPAR